MRLTFLNDTGQKYDISVHPQMELETIKAFLEAESGIPITEQSISIYGRELNNSKATIHECGILGDSATLRLRRKETVIVTGQTADQDPETMRLQLLEDPYLMEEICNTQPELSNAITNDPARLAQLLGQMHHREEVESPPQPEVQALNAHQSDVGARQRIEEATRFQAVLENMQYAVRYHPESLQRVSLLYIPVEVNSWPLTACVVTAAQQTIMSPECAKSCGIMRLLDERFSGIAKGLVTAKILGRVHTAQLKFGDLYLACSFTIMEGCDVDLLLGLDILKPHKAIIDVGKNVIRIHGCQVNFLAEDELPDETYR